MSERSFSMKQRTCAENVASKAAAHLCLLTEQNSYQKSRKGGSWELFIINLILDTDASYDQFIPILSLTPFLLQFHVKWHTYKLTAIFVCTANPIVNIATPVL